ncbi:MAG: hypothetical protein K8W52_25450 [Deltaproteobacteria bacterium]|nr:hypothetical protein [Deltaproteobacteria bacterium]
MTRLRDHDLMQLADDELDAASAAEVERALALPENAAARDRLEGVRELGELVRGHLELRADEVEDRLGAMWAEVDKQLDLVAAPVPAARPVPVRPGAWARLTAWFSAHRTHVATGLVSAGAVAALMLLVTPGGKDRVITRTVNVSPPIPPTIPVVLKREAPQVESLDTPGGTGTVFTFEDDEGGTAVILVTPNDVEGI